MIYPNWNVHLKSGMVFNVANPNGWDAMLMSLRTYNGLLGPDYWVPIDSIAAILPGPPQPITGTPDPAEPNVIHLMGVPNGPEKPNP